MPASATHESTYDASALVDSLFAEMETDDSASFDESIARTGVIEGGSLAAVQAAERAEGDDYIFDFDLECSLAEARHFKSSPAAIEAAEKLAAKEAEVKPHRPAHFASPAGVVSEANDVSSDKLADETVVSLTFEEVDENEWFVEPDEDERAADGTSVADSNVDEATDDVAELSREEALAQEQEELEAYLDSLAGMRSAGALERNTNEESSEDGSSDDDDPDDGPTGGSKVALDPDATGNVADADDEAMKTDAAIKAALASLDSISRNYDGSGLVASFSGHASLPLIGAQSEESGNEAVQAVGSQEIGQSQDEDFSYVFGYNNDADATAVASGEDIEDFMGSLGTSTALASGSHSEVQLDIPSGMSIAASFVNPMYDNFVSYSKRLSVPTLSDYAGEGDKGGLSAQEAFIAGASSVIKSLREGLTSQSKRLSVPAFAAVAKTVSATDAASSKLGNSVANLAEQVAAAQKAARGKTYAHLSVVDGGALSVDLPAPSDTFMSIAFG